MFFRRIFAVPLVRIMIKKTVFTAYEALLITMLTILQFCIVLDFAVMAPLGAQLMRELQISSREFSILVSSYAFSAGISGILLSGIADKFDRKKMLIVILVGFIVGTFLCGIAPGYHFLIVARIVAGFFGGVLSAISFAIITDVFAFEVRGRVMSFVQMAFAGSQVLGIPIGLYFASTVGWHVPFYIIVGIAIIALLIILKYIRPVNNHLNNGDNPGVLKRFSSILTNRNYLAAFATTFFLATGGFLIMPFASPFLVNNIGIDEIDLTLIFFVTGLATLVFSPIFGWMSDKYGKFNLFALGSTLASVMIYLFTQLETASLGYVILINTILAVFVSSRIITSSALLTAIPAKEERGAFMNINSSIQQLSGGVATYLGGMMLIQNDMGGFENFETLGWATIAAMALSIVLMFNIHQIVQKKLKRQTA